MHDICTFLHIMSPCEFNKKYVSCHENHHAHLTEIIKYSSGQSQKMDRWWSCASYLTDVILKWWRMKQGCLFLLNACYLTSSACISGGWDQDARRRGKERNWGCANLEMKRGEWNHARREETRKCVVLEKSDVLSSEMPCAMSIPDDDSSWSQLDQMNDEFVSADMYAVLLIKVHISFEWGYIQ